MPDATRTVSMPGTSRLFRIKSISGPWSVSKQLADLGMHARKPLALRLDLGPGAFHLVHVGRRAADVGDHARKDRVPAHPRAARPAPTPATATG